jgi:hypothetical protein
MWHALAWSELDALGRVSKDEFIPRRAALVERPSHGPG